MQAETATWKCKPLWWVMLLPQWLPEGSEPPEVAAVKAAKAGVMEMGQQPCCLSATAAKRLCHNLIMVGSALCHAAQGPKCYSLLARAQESGTEQAVGAPQMFATFTVSLCFPTGPGIWHAEVHRHGGQVPARQRLCHRPQRQQPARKAVVSP